jgi:hypothetical protein
MKTTVFALGYPGDVGGANTELWHTVNLWRLSGIEVVLVPSGPADPAWRSRLEAIGCRTVEPADRETGDNPHLPERPGGCFAQMGTVPFFRGGMDFLRGQIVVGMCNSQFLALGPRLTQLGCRTVWVSCMNWLFPAERLLYSQCGPFDRHVFQSRYQRDQLVPQLRRFGLLPEQERLIRGALCAEQLPFQPLPHTAGAAFHIGRISRAEPDKFPQNLWQTYARVPHPVKAEVLGWSRDVEAKTGPPPRWAKCLAAGAEPVPAFLQRLHAMVLPGGAAVENWPRVGLEAMAAGVPLVVEARGGWTEMIRHGQTGYLCRSDDECACYTARLAYDEEHRLAIARQARAALLDELAPATAIAAEWNKLFRELGKGLRSWVLDPDSNTPDQRPKTKDLL